MPEDARKCPKRPGTLECNRATSADDPLQCDGPRAPAPRLSTCAGASGVRQLVAAGGSPRGGAASMNPDSTKRTQPKPPRIAAGVLKTRKCSIGRYAPATERSQRGRWSAPVMRGGSDRSARTPLQTCPIDENSPASRTRATFSGYNRKQLSNPISKAVKRT